jgi:DNA end-binding protein Ku
MRALWKGAISFGLVNIPVGLYPATKAEQRISFDLLRATDHSRIRYKKVAEADGREVPREHLVKGYEYKKGHYVVLKDEDFERVKLKSTQTVDMRAFVDLADIEPRFFDQPYFLAPEKAGAKAYTLLHDALEQTGKAGIAKVVIRPPREHLAVVKPLDGILMLETMHFANELRDPSELDVPKVSTGQKELKMAISLVEGMSDKWKPEKYRDEYHDALMDAIEQKVKAGDNELPAPKAKGAARPSKVIDLVSILQESIAQTGQRPPSKKTVKRKSQARRKAA